MSDKRTSTSYRLICGAEIHVELRTKSKMFCGCKNDPFNANKPNIYTCPVCLGLPGALPVPNKKAIQNCLLIGLALNCEIAGVSKFDRKHYFYPDLPKGYQISQYNEPFCIKGYLNTSFGRVGITRVHLEEDTAKLTHTTVDGKKLTLIDFNRSGVPLVEIVTEPDIHSPEQAKECLKKIRDLIRTLGVSDCDMEKGSLRLEANISLTKDGSLPSYKVEVKNLNSFRFFANSLIAETKRQTAILGQGQVPIQETRGYRSSTNSTVSQRSKEGAADYRYFPEPDIPPFVISRNWVNKLRQTLPELPSSKIASLIDSGISKSAAEIIVKNQEMMKFIAQVKIMNPSYLSHTANDLVNKKIDYRTVLPQTYLSNRLTQKDSIITDENIIKPLIKNILADNPKVVADYRAGKISALGFFVGIAMKLTAGKADPRITKQILRRLLAK